MLIYAHFFKKLRKKITTFPDNFLWDTLFSLALCLVIQYLLYPLVEKYIERQIVKLILESNFEGLVLGSLAFHQYNNKKKPN